MRRMSPELARARAELSRARSKKQRKAALEKVTECQAPSNKPLRMRWR